MRRRRRKSSFSKPSVIGGLAGGRVVIGLGALAFIGLFAFFMHQATSTPPETQETRIELPDAFK